MYHPCVNKFIGVVAVIYANEAGQPEPPQYLAYIDLAPKHQHTHSMGTNLRCLGAYKTEAEAALAHDRAAVSHGRRPSNFTPAGDSGAEIDRHRLSQAVAGAAPAVEASGAVAAAPSAAGEECVQVNTLHTATPDETLHSHTIATVNAQAPQLRASASFVPAQQQALPGLTSLSDVHFPSLDSLGSISFNGLLTPSMSSAKSFGLTPRGVVDSTNLNSAEV